MADKVVLEAEVKSNIGEVSKDAAGLASEFKVMGVSLNSVKAGFVSAGRSAKVMFGSIKAGIMSTGIGALIIAFGSLATFFTKTKKGAEQLEVAFAGIGAAVNVIVDRVSKFGGAIVKLFQGNVKGALTDVKGAFTGIGEEIVNDTKQAIALKQAFVALRDSERDLNVETAQRRAEIEALKLIAEDVSKSEEERLAAAKEAFKIENDLLDKRVANAEEALRLQQEEMALGENMQEDLDREAELLINLADIRAESTTKQIELNNKINSIEAEVAAKRAERNQVRLDEIAAEKKASDDLYDAQIAQANAFEVRVKTQADKEKAIAKDLENFKQATIQQGFGAAAAMAGENVALSKGVAAAQVIYNTQQGIMAAMGATSIADKLLPYPLRLANAIATGVMGAAALSKIMSTNPSGAGIGGGGGMTAPATPAPQMMSGAFELSGGVAPEAMKAFVVTDEMTSSQNQLANIRRRATI
tara:strand:- start:19 stop:1434 length:1416 start_codon:yes stop_codon:yes gene_type:complete